MKFDRDFSEILSSELVANTGGIISGTLLAIFTDKLYLIPGLFILLPGFLQLKGAIAGTLAARLGTELHIGRIKPGKKSRLIAENKAASFILIFFISLILGVMSYLLTFFIFDENYPAIMLIPVVASIISSIVLFPITTKLAIWLYKNHHDPDNVMGPYVTSLGDIESILSLLIAMLVMT
ncbi:magnesium transporter [Candidatus Woesearchaeota archaeon]|nr:magnesium transporter [Candidatus Woesearchaeota archaeon]